MFNLMNSCSKKDPTVSIGARGLSHGRYKDCYFWDTDLFMVPFFIENDLEAAKNLCEYRVRSLPAAKAHSKKMNTKGARYPWMATLDGSEQCETWDIGCSELHVTADVVYALDSYCKASNDTDFYLDKAAEVFIETARFWVSRYTYRPETGKADLLFCKGPDEYCGITNNNLFTNVMVQHNLDLAIQAASDLQAMRPDRYTELGITPDEIDRMEILKMLSRGRVILKEESCDRTTPSICLSPLRSRRSKPTTVQPITRFALIDCSDTRSSSKQMYFSS